MFTTKNIGQNINTGQDTAKIMIFYLSKYSTEFSSMANLEIPQVKTRVT